MNTSALQTLRCATAFAFLAVVAGAFAQSDPIVLGEGVEPSLATNRIAGGNSRVVVC
jgi:hypothetical protein